MSQWYMHPSPTEGGVEACRNEPLCEGDETCFRECLAKLNPDVILWATERPNQFYPTGKIQSRVSNSFVAEKERIIVHTFDPSILAARRSVKMLTFFDNHSVCRCWSLSMLIYAGKLLEMEKRTYISRSSGMVFPYINCLAASLRMSTSRQMTFQQPRFWIELFEPWEELESNISLA